MITRRSFRQWIQFLKCCWYSRMQWASSYGCPVCYDYGDEKTVIKISDRHYSSNEYGGTDWLETHKCSNCGTIYEISNGSH